MLEPSEPFAPPRESGGVILASLTIVGNIAMQGSITSLGQALIGVIGAVGVQITMWGNWVARRD